MAEPKPNPEKAVEIEPGIPDNLSPEEEVEATSIATEDTAGEERYGEQHLGLGDDETEE